MYTTFPLLNILFDELMGFSSTQYNHIQDLNNQIYCTYYSVC